MPAQPVRRIVVPLLVHPHQPNIVQRLLNAIRDIGQTLTNAMSADLPFMVPAQALVAQWLQSFRDFPACWPCYCGR